MSEAKQLVGEQQTALELLAVSTEETDHAELAVAAALRDALQTSRTIPMHTSYISVAFSAAVVLLAACRCKLADAEALLDRPHVHCAMVMHKCLLWMPEVLSWCMHTILTGINVSG